MRRRRNATQAYLLDNNAFVSAIRTPRRETATLRLILKMAWDPTVTLIGDDLLAEEMTRYAELLDSDTAATTLATLISKMEIVDVQEKYVKICLNYIETPDKADIVHAAACLQTDATLISNDRHFDRIAEERIIRVLSIAEAIKTLES